MTHSKIFLVIFLICSACSGKQIIYREGVPQNNKETAEMAATSLKVDNRIFDIETGLPDRPKKYLTTAPFKMTQGFPKMPGAFNVLHTVENARILFDTKAKTKAIQDFYRKYLTSLHLEEVQPNSTGVNGTTVIEFSGWPTKERLAIIINDQLYSSKQDVRSVTARLVPLD